MVSFNENTDSKNLCDCICGRGKYKFVSFQENFHNNEENRSFKKCTD